MFCPRCSREIKDIKGTGLCLHCGTKMEDSGSQFEEESEASVQQGSQPGAGASTKVRKILLIEDDVWIGGQYKDQFELAGYELDIVGRGDEGEKALKDGGYDLVLLDLMLPGESGLELLETIKADPQLAPIPVFVVSSFDQMDIIEKAISLGAQDFFTKSTITPKELCTAIDEYFTKLDSEPVTSQ